MTKKFKKNKNGKIEFTELELSSLLNEVWNDGYYLGHHSVYEWHSPWWYPYYPYYITSTTGTVDVSPTVTWNSSDVKTTTNATISTKNSDTYTVTANNPVSNTTFATGTHITPTKEDDAIIKFGELNV